MKLLLMLLLLLPGCGKWEQGESEWQCVIHGDCKDKSGEPGRDGLPGVRGLPGSNGLDGSDGQDGAAGTSGARGQDGANGNPGEPGSDGQDGMDGSPGSDGLSIQVVTPCQLSNSHPIRESFLRIGGLLYGTYWAGGQAFSGLIPPGSYTTTDGGLCTFTVTTSLNLIDKDDYEFKADGSVVEPVMCEAKVIADYGHEIHLEIKAKKALKSFTIVADNYIAASDNQGHGVWTGAALETHDDYPFGMPSNLIYMQGNGLTGVSYSDGVYTNMCTLIN